jgi:L-iditol 2-dehydrogenase
MQLGSTVVVIGSGIAGLLQVMLAHAFGAGRVIATDISEYRLEAARRLGADIAINAKEDLPSRLRQANQGLLADLVIVCTGAPPAITQALKLVERGGTILFFATTNPSTTTLISMNELFWRTEITITSSYGGSPGDYQTALDLIGAKTIPVSQMITHRLPLSKTGLGFQLVAEGQNSIKVIIEPQK